MLVGGGITEPDLILGSKCIDSDAWLGVHLDMVPAVKGWLFTHERIPRDWRTAGLRAKLQIDTGCISRTHDLELAGSAVTLIPKAMQQNTSRVRILLLRRDER